MSHGITDTDTPVYVGRKAWHDLGNVISEDEAREMTFMQLAAKANLLYPVEAHPVYVKVIDEITGTETYVEAEGFAGNVRRDSNAVLAITTTDYEVGQNEELARLLDAINLAAHDGRIIDPANAVTLQGGKVAFMTGALREPIILDNGETLEPYVLVVTSHDRSQATKGRSAVRRPDCENMLRGSLRQQVLLDFTIKHTKNRAEQVTIVENAMATMVNANRNFQAEANALIARQVTDDEFDAIIKGAFPIGDKDGDRKRVAIEATRSLVAGLWKDSPEVGANRGTGWGAYQAISTWEQHLRPATDQFKTNVLASVGSGFKISEDVARQLLPN